jgi:hypothetical protein
VERDLNGRQEEIKREIDSGNKSLGMKEWSFAKFLSLWSSLPMLFLFFV